MIFSATIDTSCAFAGPPDPPRRVQLVEEQQVLVGVVLRELCADADAEAVAGHPQAAARHHGPPQAGRRLLRQVDHARPEGHLLGVLPKRRQEGPAGVYRWQMMQPYTVIRRPTHFSHFLRVRLCLL